MARENRKLLTDYMVRKLKPPSSGQLLIFDSVQSGLAVLVGHGGVKSLRSHYQLHGRWRSRSLGRFDEISADSIIAWARSAVAADKRKAANGIDPRVEDRPTTLLFEDAVGEFIETHAKVRQRKWAETQRVLLTNCKPWLERPLDSITTADAYKLLDKLIATGRAPTARVTLSWLRTLWKWAGRRSLVSNRTAMADVDLVFEKRVRERVYSDAELAAIWRAADKLDVVVRCYVHLLMLTGSRTTALAKMQWEQLDDAEHPTLWTTPPERVKQRKLARQRVYLTPLSGLAQQVMAELPRRHPLFCFPSTTRRDVTIDPGTSLKDLLVEHGAPADFQFHALRHTLASHFPRASDFEIGLLLNHSGSGTVTQGYRHRDDRALLVKRELLEQWAAHLAGLVRGGN